MRNRARAWLLSGALVEMGPAAGSGRVVDASATAAGFVEPVRTVRCSAAGGAIVFGGLPNGRRVLLRVAGAGWPGDPRPGHEALRALAGRDLIPRALAAGEIGGASWALESALAGVRPQRLEPSLAEHVSRFAATLPRSQRSPSSVERDVSFVGSVLPSRAEGLRAVSERAAALATKVEGIARHGDLWLGNLLVLGVALSGVVDWDAWDPNGVPGADLLHLFATDLGLASRRELGEVWVEAPWRSDAFRSFSAPYWSGLGASPAQDALLLAGIAWWAAAVAGTLARAPHRAADERWIVANVDGVVERIPQL